MGSVGFWLVLLQQNKFPDNGRYILFQYNSLGSVTYTSLYGVYFKRKKIRGCVLCLYFSFNVNKPNCYTGFR